MVTGVDRTDVWQWAGDQKRLIAPVVLQNPTVVSDCTPSGLQAALTGGGEIAFACGTEPVTIALTTPLRVTAKRTVDRWQVIATRSLVIRTRSQNPLSTAATRQVIQNSRFIRGRAPASGGLASESGAAITSGSPARGYTFSTAPLLTIIRPAPWATRIIRVGRSSNNSYETVVVGSHFANNQAGNGGAIGGLASWMIIVNSRFVNNRAKDTTAPAALCVAMAALLHLDGVTNGFNPASNKTVQICGSSF
ncbi:MAG: hypothetical protein R2932_49070 [Caldilineaceae bacterium]